jgi:large repetitive protein
MQNYSTFVAHGRNRFVGAAFSLFLILGAMLWPALASAQVSLTCPSLTRSVPFGGSVVIDVSACDGIDDLGIGPHVPATSGILHGSVTISTVAPQTLTYTHNGTTGAGTLDDFTVIDNNVTPGFITFNINIGAATSPITINPATLPAVTLATPFSQTLTSTGGTAPYTYNISAGTLPVGLSLSPGGVISGTPTQRGNFSFTVRALDSAGTPLEGFRSYNGTIQIPTLSVSPSAMTAVQGAPFSQALSAAVGVAPFTFALDGTSPALPAGLTLSGGVISGTTSAAPGVTNLRINATDSSTGSGLNTQQSIVAFTVSPPPSVSIAVSPASVSEDGATNLTYTLTRSLNLSSATVVNLLIGGTALAGTDYTGNATTVSIPAGATTATIVIDPTLDGTVEANETVIIGVNGGTGYTVGTPNSATATILNDDVPTATIAVAPASVAEDGAPNLVYTVTLNQANPGAATSVNYTIGGTATNGADYAAITSPLVIPAGNTTGTITVNPAADTTIEADETVTLTLAAGTGYTVGVPNGAAGTITNDDLPNLTINDVTVNEGNAGITNFSFTVSLSAPAGPGGVTFNIATANGTATAGTDYVAQSLTGQTIPAGSSTYIFTVLVNGDTLNEANETFFVNVTSVTNAVVVDGQGVGTITNDDPLPTISTSNISVVEGNSGTTNAVVTVTLNTASGRTVTVNYQTGDGTATQPADYTSTSGTLTFTPPQTTQTITVPVIGETVPEANEIFSVGLFGATNATISAPTSFVTITNDDVPVTVSPTTLLNGQVGLPYSQTVSASGGTGPYTFAVTAGALPAGVTLSPAGTLSGTPTAGGSFSFTVTATDSSAFPGPYSGSQAYTFTMADGEVVLPPDTLPDGTLGVAYTGDTGPATGAIAPYTYAVTAGALPGGLTINASSGQITGIPSAIGTFNFSLTATDSSTGTGPYDITENYTVVIVDIPPVVSNSSLTVAYNAPATNVPLSITGGMPTSLTITTMPANGTAIVSGTTITYQPTVGYAGADSFSYTATNSGGTSAPATVSITVQDPVITITPTGGFAATVGAAYNNTFDFNGGAQPWSGYQVTGLPAGLSITGTTANTVTISGTPTEAGAFNLNVSATDSSTGRGPFAVGQAFTLTVAAPTLALAPAAGTTFTATYITPFTQTFTATGGIGPYTYAYSGASPLPAGFTFNTSTGVLSGTPTTVINQTFTITATDTGSTGTGAPFTIAQNYSLFSAAPTITVTPAAGPLPNATPGVPYSTTLTASGGAAPYLFLPNSGSPPPGINIGSNGVISGTTTQVGTFTFRVLVRDANSFTFGPAQLEYTITVDPPTLTMTPAPGTLNAPYATPFSQTFTAAGGSGSFSYALTGTLPAGMSFSGNTISGTPTAPGSYPITVTATDTVITGVGAPFTVANNYTIDVPAPTIVVNPATLPDPTANVAYSQTLTATGGAAPYGFAVTAGSLPPGITLASGGGLSGTSVQVGTYNFTITASDNFGQTGSRAYTVTIAAPTLTMTPAAGTLNAPYATAFSQTFAAAGGSGSFSYALTGTLPAGLTFTGNTISGTPTVPGSYPITITATDTVLTGVGAPFSIAQNYTIDVPAPTIVVDPATLPNTTAGLSYSQTLSAAGGAAPYTFAVTAGALPNGVTLSSGGALSGTTNTSGTFNFTVTATDANGQTGSRAYTVVVAVPTITLTPATLPGGVAGTAYNQVLTISGGIAPYTVTQTGALPSGITFNAATRTFSGTPTQSGSFPISVTVTDSTGGTAATVTNNYTLTIAVPTLTLTPAAGALPAGTGGTAYNQTFTASGGIAPYTYALASGALPAGLTFNAATGTIAGTPTVAGNFSFSIRATDSTAGTAATVTNAYTLAIAVPTITINPPVLGGNGVIAVPYTRNLTAIGGTAPYAFAVSAGALPPGITLSATGTLSGSPTTVGTYNFTVRATDALGFTGTRAYTVGVVQRPDPSRDPEVRGLIEAQADATRRFATTQINNFQQRLERLHGADSGGGFDNGLSVSFDQYCPEMVGALPGRRCDRPNPGNSVGAGIANNAEGSRANEGGNQPFGIWASGMIRSGNHDGRNGSADIDFETDGVSFGIDYRVNGAFTIGGGVGYGTDGSDIGRNGTRSEADAYTFAVYGSYSPGDVFFLDGLWGYQTFDYDLRRFVTSNGNFVRGDRGGSQWFGSVSVGADIAAGHWQFTPYARVDVARATLDGYTETGDAIFALSYNQMEVDTDTANAGVRIDYRHDTGWGTFSPQLRLEYQRDFKATGEQALRYADLPAGPFYRVEAVGFDRSRLMIGLGALFDFDSGWSFKIDYRGLIGSGEDSDHGVQLNVEKKY